MAHRGKKYKAALAKVDRTKAYAAIDAIKMVKNTSYAKFDATVEAHLNMGLDPRQADQQVRGSVLMPSGLGKTVRVLVFTEGDSAKAAVQAGADYVADDETITKIMGGWAEFDVAIAIPSMMGKVGRLGRILGPRGLMPNPKSGTVVAPDDVAQAVREAKAGRVEFRLDKSANIHVPIGKTSFSEEALLANLTSFLNAIKRSKPSAAKGNYIKRSTLAATMGPGIRVDPNTIDIE
jgi:large subunit ribosomal protein L1